MKIKWHFFFAAAFFAGWALISNGIPFAPVLLGIALAGGFNLWNRLRSAARR